MLDFAKNAHKFTVIQLKVIPAMVIAYYSKLNENNIPQANGGRGQYQVDINAVNEAFPDCAVKVDVPATDDSPADDFSDLAKFRSRDYDCVVLPIESDDDTSGQFTSPGIWLLKGITPDQFGNKFRPKP